MVTALLIGLLSFSASAEETTSKMNLNQLKAQVAELQGKKICQQDSHCRTAGLGHKPCGGPRKYIVYSTRDAQEKPLLQVLRQIARLERTQQKSGGLMGACVVTPEPQVSCQDQLCQ